MVKRRFKIGRKQALCLEGRGCVAGYRENTFTLTMWISHQLPYVVRHYLAKHLRLAETDVRVIVPHTGGGFGQKASIYPEEFVCGWLALQLRRPVKWVEDRIENMVASTHARDQIIELRDGGGQGRPHPRHQLRYLGRCRRLLHLSLVGRHGAVADRGADARSVPHRGDALSHPRRRHQQDAGRALSRGRPPVGVGSLELLIDEMARKLKLDPVEMRLRNLIPGEAMPYRNANNLVHDNVNYVPCLKLSVAKSEYERQRAEQREPQANGKLRGVGVACFAELTGLGTSTAVGPGTLLQPGRDAATLRLETSGVLTIAAALPSQGQRIMTAMRQVASDELGIKLEDITSITNDTATAPYGFGTFASRTAVFGSGAVIKAARELRQRILAMAAFILQVPIEELTIANSVVQTVDRAKSISLRDMAEKSYFSAKDIPQELNQGFEVTAFYDPKFGSFAAGAHIVVVDVDPKTGHVEILRYVAAEDVGTVINPAVVEGQIIGGIAQGIGEALLEELVYDEAGQPRTVTLADYLIPSALEIPRIELHHANTPSAALGGFKGCGEGSIIGALGAVACAVADALSRRGGDIHDFPATPERVLKGLGVLPGEALDEPCSSTAGDWRSPRRARRRPRPSTRP